MRIRALLLAATIAVVPASYAHADGIATPAVLEGKNKELRGQEKYLRDLKEQTDKGNILLISTPDGVVPVATSDYIETQQLKITFGKGNDAETKAKYEKLARDVAALKAGASSAVGGMIQEIQNEIHDNDNAIKLATDEDARDAASDKKEAEDRREFEEEERRRDRERIEGDLESLRILKAQEDAKTVSNPVDNHLSAEELADSPPAPDAATRTLTVDNTPPPPPDGTPIIEANTTPRPQRENADSDDANSDLATAGAIIGIVGAIAGSRSNNGGGHHGGNAPAPRTPSGHHGC